MRLLALNGSLRGGSYNGRLLDAARAACPPDVEFVVWGRLGEIRAFDEDLSAPPEPVTALRRAIARADAVLIATPEYNGSIPGALKNALDWVSRPFVGNVLRHKPVAVIGASQGIFGAVWAQAELRKVLGVIGARVDERDLPVAQVHEAFTFDGRLREPMLATRLEAIVGDLVCSAENRVAA